MSDPQLPPEEPTEFQEELLSAYLDHELSAEQVAVVEERLQSSPDLQRALEELRRIRQMVASLPSWQGPTPAFSTDQLTIDDNERDGADGDQRSPTQPDIPDGARVGQILDRQETSHGLPVSPATASSVETDRRSSRRLGQKSARSAWPLWGRLAVAASLLAITGIGYGLWQNVSKPLTLSSSLSDANRPSGAAPDSANVQAPELSADKAPSSTAADHAQLNRGRPAESSRSKSMPKSPDTIELESAPQGEAASQALMQPQFSEGASLDGGLGGGTRAEPSPELRQEADEKFGVQAAGETLAPMPHRAQAARPMEYLLAKSDAWKADEIAVALQAIRTASDPAAERSQTIEPVPEVIVASINVPSRRALEELTTAQDYLQRVSQSDNSSELTDRGARSSAKQASSAGDTDGQGTIILAFVTRAQAEELLRSEAVDFSNQLYIRPIQESPPRASDRVVLQLNPVK